MLASCALAALAGLASLASLPSGIAGAAQTAAGRVAPSPDSGHTPPPPVCGQTDDSGNTPAAVASLKIRFVFPNYWLCVPGTGPLPATVLVAERLSGAISQLVPSLRRSAVGGIYLLSGGRIPCELAVNPAGTGTLPDAAIWSQEISDDAKAAGTTLTGLQVLAVTEPGGRFLEALYTFSNPGGATYFADEYLTAVASKLVVAYFQGSPSWRNTIVAQGKLVMASFR